MVSQKRALEIYTYMENCNMSIYFDESVSLRRPFWWCIVHGSAELQT